MSRFLIVTWDGAGNLVPTLGIAARLARAGHDVRVLGHRSIHDRCGSHGWRFRALERTAAFDSAAAGARDGHMSHIARQLWFSGAVADDVGDELAREPADVLVGDCMLFGALSAAQAAAMPTVSLFHGAFALFRRGPLVDLLAPMLPALNALRDRLGLPAVHRICDVHDQCTLSLVATPREFEPAMQIPENVRFAGPILDGPRLLRRVDEVAVSSGAEPLVVVSFSTSDQGQVPLLQRCIDALASVAARAIVTTGPAVDPAALQPARNVRVIRFVPHDRLFPRASLVVTHAGLGTVMTALAHGVPMLCTPFGRDQFFNAARVEALGAGRAIRADAHEAAIADAVRQLLGDERARASATRMAGVIAEYRNGACAIDELERVARRGCGARLVHAE